MTNYRNEYHETLPKKTKPNLLISYKKGGLITYNTSRED